METERVESQNAVGRSRSAVTNPRALYEANCHSRPLPNDLVALRRNFCSKKPRSPISKKCWTSTNPKKQAKDNALCLCQRRRSKPGVFAVAKTLTLYDAVTAAGGLTPAAWTVNIKATRPLADGTFPETRRFLASDLKTEKSVQQHALRVGDLVVASHISLGPAPEQ